MQLALLKRTNGKLKKINLNMGNLLKDWHSGFRKNNFLRNYRNSPNERVCKKKSVNHCEYRTQKPSDLVQLVSTYKEDFSYGKTTA